MLSSDNAKNFYKYAIFWQRYEFLQLCYLLTTLWISTNMLSSDNAKNFYKYVFLQIPSYHSPTGIIWRNITDDFQRNFIIFHTGRYLACFRHIFRELRQFFFMLITSVYTEMCCPKGKCGCQYFILLTLKKKIVNTGVLDFLIKKLILDFYFCLKSDLVFLFQIFIIVPLPLPRDIKLYH